MKKVSVIIPTYRRNDFILRAIDSVLSQDYPDIEILVVDDNGRGTEYQQATEEKLRSYIDTGRITYLINEHNMGGALARNEGIKAASGDYIAFLDDDDEYLPHRIKIQAELMTEKGTDVSVTDSETVNEKGERLSVKVQPFDNDVSDEELLKIHIQNHIANILGFMFTKEAITKIGMFDDIGAGQEFMLMLKALEAGYRPYVIHEILTRAHMDGQERISTRLSKIAALRRMYTAKSRYFHLLTRKEAACVKARHFGTCFYIYFVNKKYFAAAGMLICAFLASPKQTLNIYHERKGKLASGK